MGRKRRNDKHYMRHQMRAYYGTEFRSILKEAATSEALLAGIAFHTHFQGDRVFPMRTNETWMR